MYIVVAAAGAVLVVGDADYDVAAAVADAAREFVGGAEVAAAAAAAAAAEGIRLP